MQILLSCLCCTRVNLSDFEPIESTVVSGPPSSGTTEAIAILARNHFAPMSMGPPL
jgi:hypothetical protein